ncbi:Response regulator PleD [Pseudobythopirellula maris]|uniref:diguanylate cyclase n=1 Tax=Pseudobythopirellula maris TaxID=2527991 RepID=A0A5C5ZGG9_9BACT|nr:diguanylate cyclase [Pseudobythopirellula maris]TWT86316.1 Response regulator PleD [Pseudobythopirellula maris]
MRPVDAPPTTDSQQTAPQGESTPPHKGEAGNLQQISRLLSELESAAVESGQATPAPIGPNDPGLRLAEARLGIAGALFTALRCKNAAAAAHSLRVAIGCSRWAVALNMPEKLRSQLEFVALLHDIGKIGVPDAVLVKPGRLTNEEIDVLESSRDLGRHILQTTGAPAPLVEAMVASAAHFDGGRQHVPLAGDQIPFVSRMLAIVDAYDSMTTDHVYRPARSRERALSELQQCAGSQFDPDLVNSFCDLFSRDQSELERDVARRWLSRLGDFEESFDWKPELVTARPGAAGGPSPFETKLIENMHDAVLFVDSQLVITRWNTGAERLTGVAASAAVGKKMLPSLLDMSDDTGKLIEDLRCPVLRSVKGGVQVIERISVMGRNGRSVAVDLHAMPVPDPKGDTLGASVLLHDASSVATLEERCQALHTEMTKDPMTQVANRAEFDRMLASFIDAHQETGLPCSLIMADIDRFKRINDTYGHQAGDAAIMTFAKLLKTSCRSGDLVARYGGEEFAVLCADCNNASAARRAEQMRKRLAETSHSELGGNPITASFGVTELQPGDTPESMLRRSDRGLLLAKDQGRNQVVQLGDGMGDAPKAKKSWWKFPVWGGAKLIETRLVTNVPIEIAVEKLRGFISDRDAKILHITENELRLQVTELIAVSGSTVRPQDFMIDMLLSQEHIERTNSSGLASGKYVQTNADVTIRPKRDRDRRQKDVSEQARRLLGSLKSYLMAKETSADPPKAEPAPSEPAQA